MSAGLASVEVGGHAIEVCRSVFYRSWGYDQTNVNLYLVIGITPSGKSVKLREINAHVLADMGPQVYVEPDDSTFYDPHRRWCAKCSRAIEWRTNEQGERVSLVHRETWAMQCINSAGDYVPAQFATEPEPVIYTKRLQTWGDVPTLSWDSYSNAYLWRGETIARTGTGYGH
jgi:hypothetical protein